MTTKFWEKVGEGIAGLWSAQALTLSFAFWATGLLFWMLQDPQRMCGLFMPEGTAIAMLVGGLVVVALSSWVVQRLSLPLLRWFEGYWLIKPLRFWMTGRVNGWLKKKEQTWDRLAKGYKEGTLSAEEMESYACLDTELAAYPVDERLRMPTQIGNLLRAAEECLASATG